MVWKGVKDLKNDILVQNQIHRKINACYFKFHPAALEIKDGWRKMISKKCSSWSMYNTAFIMTLGVA